MNGEISSREYSCLIGRAHEILEKAAYELKNLGIGPTYSAEMMLSFGVVWLKISSSSAFAAEEAYRAADVVAVDKCGSVQ